MADNTEETNPQVAEAEEPVTPATQDQNFAYWMVMLPFLAIAAVFLFEFSKTPGEYTKLINAAGSIVVGIFAATFVNVLTGEKSEDGSNTTGNEAPKAS